MRQTPIHLLVLAIAALSLSSLNARAAEPAPPQRVLRVRTLGDPLTLDWNRAYSPVESILIRNLMEGLVSINSRMKVVGQLATKWTISPDGLTYSFELRKDVHWSDGAPLRAQQFVDSWRRLLSPAFNANYAYLLFDIENAQAYHEGKTLEFERVGVKAVGDSTLVVKLRAPVAYWIWIPTFWATFPVRQDLIDKLGGDWVKPGKLVTLGPFLYDSYESHHTVRLVRYPGYSGARGNIDVIESALIEDEALAIRLYDDNQLDFLTRLGLASHGLTQRGDLMRWAEARVAHLDFNVNFGPTTDVRVRRAIGLAIDRKRLVEQLEGASAPATTFTPPGIMGYSSQGGIGYDPRLARETLAKAGFGEAHPLALELVVAAYSDDLLAGDFIASELHKNLGAIVKVHQLEAKNFYSPMLTTSSFSLILNRWTADFPDPDNFYSIFLAGSGNNRVAWKNADYDAAVAGARSILEPRRRALAYARIERLLVEENVVALPLYYGRNCALVRQSIKGFHPTPTNSYLFKDFSLP